MEISLLKQADQILSKCGRPRIEGATAVPFYRAFLMPMVLEPGESITFIKEITGETTWALRAIQSSVGSDTTTGVRLQIQLPNGRFLFGGKNGIDAGQFCWVGSWRYNHAPALDCQPGDKIRVTLTDVGGLAAAIAVNLLFEGEYKYYLKGDSLAIGDPLASDVPRYQRIVNENILAPCYIAGVGPQTPYRAEDEFFTYSTQLETFTVGSGVTSATLRTVIDTGLDFHCRRMLFDVQADSGATAGIFLGRVRASSGYALCDSYVDLERYLCANEWAKDWRIRGGDEIYVDVSLTDAVGTTFSIQAHFEGVRRRA